ncbi:MAG: 50S ribosomal protein L18 [Candidatus Aenigmarchaeota archaeon]|nr:50S ribosomal protein L18 [Candidatus Aenigmarchaeota archaeon]OYT56439.1 MAG: 50S ribosomal protein L18 [Candidatus Aenigmarchaeota archaeon ex4484_14]
MPFRRRIEKKTNYRKRLALLKSGLPRIVIRKSLNYVNVQMVNYEPYGDKVIFAFSSKSLKKFGWSKNCSNTPAAYLVGFLFGMEAKKRNLLKAVVDFGLQRSTKGNLLYAVIAGLKDAGLDINVDSNMLPSDERIKGKHISDDIENEFQEVKKKIQESYQ